MSDRNRRGSKTTDSWAVQVQDTFTRPTNTDAYATNDVISATTSDTGTTVLRSLQLAAAPGKPFWLCFLRLWTDLDTFTSTVRVHFYNVEAPPTAIAGDNAAFSRAYANKAAYLGYVDLPALADVGDGAAAQRDDVRMLLSPLAGDPGSVTASRLVYYRLEVTAGAATPSSGQSFNLTARAVDA